MPQYTSVRPANGESNGRSLRETDQSNVSTSIQSHHRAGDQQNPEQNSRPNYPHMTLDGRRRPRPNANGDATQSHDEEHWHDWTSTWRKMGTKGHSKPVTMTGTITRGKKKGQVVDVHLDLTDRELLEITAAHELTRESVASSTGSIPSSGKKEGCLCGLNDGPHVLLLSIILFPFILIASLFASFYFGALTWQNIFTHFYDERTICHRILLCPLLVLSFPIFIVIFTLGIAIYAAFVQLRWSFLDWKDEVGSLEKGFYGWLCGKLDLEDCCPYTVVELFDSTEDLDEPGEQSLRNEGFRENTARTTDSVHVAIVHPERRNSEDQPSTSRDQPRPQRQRGSLPSMGHDHVHAQRMESSM